MKAILTLLTEEKKLLEKEFDRVSRNDPNNALDQHYQAGRLKGLEFALGMIKALHTGFQREDIKESNKSV